MSSSSFYAIGRENLAFPADGQTTITNQGHVPVSAR